MYYCLFINIRKGLNKVSCVEKMMILKQGKSAFIVIKENCKTRLYFTLYKKKKTGKITLKKILRDEMYGT